MPLDWRTEGHRERTPERFEKEDALLRHAHRWRSRRLRQKSEINLIWFISQKLSIGPETLQEKKYYFGMASDIERESKSETQRPTCFLACQLSRHPNLVCYSSSLKVGEDEQ